jgi:lactoylglutathione lyase
MVKTVVSIDHVHLVSRDPGHAAAWYVEMLGCRVLKEIVSFGAPQIYLSFGDALLIIRGRRATDLNGENDGQPVWGVEHFGFRITGEYDTLCAEMKRKNVRFVMDPVDINATTRAAFVEGPDGVTIELLERRDWPDLQHFGAGNGISPPQSASRSQP